jgi:hypothetical protein
MTHVSAQDNDDEHGENERMTATAAATASIDEQVTFGKR